MANYKPVVESSVVVGQLQNLQSGDVLVEPGTGLPYLTTATGGSVTTVSIVSANGVSGTVANPTTTPTITLALGNITPATVNGNTLTTGSGTLILATFTLTVTGTASVSGTNTGDQDLSGYVPTTRTVNGQALSSDIIITTISGNAGTATALQTARTINGVSFDGTADITVTAAADTLTGSMLASGVTDSSLVSFGASPTLVTPTIASFVNATHDHHNAAGGGTLTEAALALSDVATNDVTASQHGFAPKLPGDASKFLNGVGAYSVSTVELDSIGNGGVTISVAATKVNVSRGTLADLTGGEVSIETYNILLYDDVAYLGSDPGLGNISLNNSIPSTNVIYVSNTQRGAIDMTALWAAAAGGLLLVMGKASTNSGLFSIDASTAASNYHYLNVTAIWGSGSLIVGEPVQLLFFPTNPNLPGAMAGDATHLGWFGANVVQQVANDALTDSSGGAASTTVKSVSDPLGTLGTLVANINDNMATMAAQFNKIEALLTNYKLGT